MSEREHPSFSAIHINSDRYLSASVRQRSAQIGDMTTAISTPCNPDCSKMTNPRMEGLMAAWVQHQCKVRVSRELKRAENLLYSGLQRELMYMSVTNWCSLLTSASAAAVKWQ
jgi:hypothetical protein